MHTQSPSLLRTARVATLGVMSIIASFALGIHTAGDVQPIASLEANEPGAVGDMDGDGIVAISDVIVVLEIAQGTRTASPQQLLADPNRDGSITSDDALRLLRNLASR